MKTAGAGEHTDDLSAKAHKDDSRALHDQRLAQRLAALLVAEHRREQATERDAEGNSQKDCGVK
jgi:hypothetical protein